MMIEVVAGLIKVGSKFLIAKRTYGDAPAIGKWEFPGGKIEPSETDEEAIKREILEELGIEVNPQDYLCDYVQVYPNRTIHLKLYFCVSTTSDVVINSEHTEYALVDFKEIDNYDLAPADQALYDAIKNNFSIE